MSSRSNKNLINKEKESSNLKNTGKAQVKKDNKQSTKEHEHAHLERPVKYLVFIFKVIT